MKIALIILSLICLVNYSISDKCSDLSLVKHDCSYYIECLEANYHCGPDGYPVGYGNKYCSKFLQFFDDFPPEGKQWVEKTLTCLKGAIQPNIKSSLTCQNIFDIAFDSHPDCYVQSGFCTALLNNMTSMTKALIEVYEVKDFLSFTSMKQVVISAGKCGMQVSIKLIEAIKEILGKSFEYDFEKIDNPFN